MGWFNRNTWGTFLTGIAITAIFVWLFALGAFVGVSAVDMYKKSSPDMLSQIDSWCKAHTEKLEEVSGRLDALDAGHELNGKTLYFSVLVLSRRLEDLTNKVSVVERQVETIKGQLWR